MKFVIPCKTVTESNAKEFWRVKYARSKQQRAITAQVVAPLEKPSIPCVVQFTRVSRGIMDDDNLPSSIKHLRDEIAKWLGVDDRHRHIVRYEYDQRRGAPPCIEVEIVPMEVVK